MSKPLLNLKILLTFMKIPLISSPFALPYLNKSTHIKYIRNCLGQVIFILEGKKARTICILPITAQEK